MKKVILLNGPSSAGKSTLSKCLQDIIEKRINKRYEIVSIDNFMKLAEDETIYEDDVFEISGDMCVKTLEFLKEYNGVIIDHVITSERIFSELKNYLTDYDLKSVHVSCPLEVLLKREIERHNRCLGSAESSYTYLYPKEGYELTVDTNSHSTLECTIEIFENLILNC